MPYRDDQPGLEARREELRSEIADADRRIEALSGAVGEKQKLTRELASVEKRLRRAGGLRLPLLEDIRIASPCSARWEDMEGDDRVRFCGPCQKNVYNLSAMAREEAERLIAARDGSVCVRLYRRTDGTVITADCPVGVRRRRVRRAVAAVAGTGALAAMAAAAFTTQQGDIGPPEHGQAVMQGAIDLNTATATSQADVPIMGGTAAVEAPAPPPALMPHAKKAVRR